MEEAAVIMVTLRLPNRRLLHRTMRCVQTWYGAKRRLSVRSVGLMSGPKAAVLNVAGFIQQIDVLHCHCQDGDHQQAPYNQEDQEAPCSGKRLEVVLHFLVILNGECFHRFADGASTFTNGQDVEKLVGIAAGVLERIK